MSGPGSDPETIGTTVRDVAAPVVAAGTTAQVEPNVQLAGDRSASDAALADDVAATVDPTNSALPAETAHEEAIDISTADTPATPNEAEPLSAVTANIADVVAPPPDPAILEPAARNGPAGFVRERVEVSEGDGFVRLIVRAPADLTTELPVRIVVESGSAIAGKDFVAPTRDQLEFTPDAREKIVLIPLIADANDEFIEDFNVRLEVPEQELRFENSAVVVIVKDDD
jgi:hypothetical protein